MSALAIIAAVVAFELLCLLFAVMAGTAIDRMGK